jgi:hypothetical protein
VSLTARATTSLPAGATGFPPVAGPIMTSCPDRESLGGGAAWVGEERICPDSYIAYTNQVGQAVRRKVPKNWKNPYKCLMWQ